MSIYPYVGILTAAAIEGEVVYAGAVVMATLGRLDPLAVLVSGSVGGWAGDQFWFYAARGRLSSWVDKFEKIAGLRIAIPLACAYAGISPVHFSGLSFISALGWAGAIMLVIQRLGPTSLSALGIKAWWTPAIPAVLVILFFRWLSRAGPDK
jgi:membrane protein DedA with SNARE-associated domain